MDDYTSLSNTNPNDSPHDLKDPLAILEKAINAPAGERASVLLELAFSLKDTDPFTVSEFAKKAKGHDLCTITDFKNSVRYFQNKSSDEGTKRSPPTDDELRDRWLMEYSRTAYGLGDYRRYMNGIWEIVEDLTVKDEISKILESAKNEGMRPTSTRLYSVEVLARANCFIPTIQWDDDPDILVCRNETLHIPTRTTRDHDPSDYATSGLPYEYDPDAIAPTWTAILNRLEVDQPGISDFLQEYSGYALNTETKYEIALWLYGPPGCGKSTFILGLESMLGSRAGVLGISNLLYQFGLSNLLGKTLVVSTEQPFGRRVPTHVLNSIISGEKIIIDRKYKDPFEYKPFAKVVWALHEPPHFIDPHSGINRRVKAVEFPPLEKPFRDPNIKKHLADEGPGILNWALDGLERLTSRDRFNIPQVVIDTTEKMKNIIESPSSFVTDRCTVDPSLSTQSEPLYRAYTQYCSDKGIQPQSLVSIASTWKRLGFRKKRSGGRSYWIGIGVFK